MSTIKIGDSVLWSGCWGRDPQQRTTITEIEHCPNGGKYGESVNEIDTNRKDECVFTLENGHWAYGYQIQLTNKKTVC